MYVCEGVEDGDRKTRQIATKERRAVFVCEERNESVREQTDVRLTGNSSESDRASGKELRDAALSCPGLQRSMPSHLSDL